MRAYAEAALLVALWMALGFGLRLDANSYLLVGVPLSIVFQLAIARRRLRAAWLRDPPGASVDWRWTALAVLLAVCPVIVVVRAFAARQVVVGLWGIAAIARAGGAAYALRNRRPGLAREMVRCLAIAGAIGMFWVLLPAVAQQITGVHPAHASILVGLRAFALYFPVCFVLEEVTFRGVLDTHVAQRDPGRWRSALFVSALWGAWHLPIVHVAGPRVAALPFLLVVHMTIGVPLSFAWRRSGNLAVPALAHAAIDAVRNAFMGV